MRRCPAYRAVPPRPPSGSPDGSSAWPTSDDPSHWNYWRREARTYQAGLAGAAYGEAGIAGPSLLEARERADGGAELWLADVSGPGGFGWPAARTG